MTELDSRNKDDLDLELDDLLISNNDEELSGGSGKKILLLSAIGILLLAIVVIVVYMFQGDSKEQDLQAFETQKPLERVEAQIPPRTNETKDYGQEPIQSNSDDQFQRIIDQIKAQQSGNTTAQNTQSSQNLPSVPQSQPTQPTQPKQAEVKPPVQPVQSQPVQQKQPKPARQEAPKPTVADTFKNVETSDPALQGTQGGNATKGFYIQVGSFSKFAPNKQLLGQIESENFSYRMQKSGDNNRLLIGPYATKQEAQSHLSGIRAKINKDAFIKEIR